MKDIVIIGAGGVGRETAWIIEQINSKSLSWNILGFVDDNKEIQGTDINGYTVLGTIDNLDKINSDIYLVIAISNYEFKKNTVEKLKGKFKFATIIHPDNSIDKSVEIGDGTIIYPGVIMTTNIKIGNHVILSPKCGIGHDSIIGNYVSLLWNVNISGFNVIEDGVLIGSAATVIQGKKIGRSSIVGAGAVVIKDIEKGTTNVGVPTHVVKLR